MHQQAFSFNTTIDVRADEIAYPRDAHEVVALVTDARRRGLRVAATATGHNVGAYGQLDGHVLIDVRNLQTVEIDVDRRIVRVGAGVKWERVTPRLSELGLAALHGSSPDVGVAGYSLGGGIGWLSRRHGMQANAVTAIEVVLADGRHVRADATHEPDLFWALRGGNGNFGVVTAIEFAVFPIAELYAGAMFFPFERSREIVHTWAAMLGDLPDELTTWIQLMHFPEDPALPEFLRGGSFAVVLGAFVGDEPEGARLLAPLRALGPAIDTFAMVPPSALGELAMDPPDPLPIDLGGQLLDGLPADAVDALLDAALEAPLAMVQLRHMGGALGRVRPGAGARATLPGEVCLLALGVVLEDAMAAPVRAAIERIEHVTTPWRAGEYPNFVERPADARGFFDDATWSRLRAVKAAYDPGALFRGNHAIPPATEAERLAA
jgi:FAD/FMN-containing dehydrogenase